MNLEHPANNYEWDTIVEDLNAIQWDDGIDYQQVDHPDNGWVRRQPPLNDEYEDNEYGDEENVAVEEVEDDAEDERAENDVYDDEDIDYEE
jgi:hypothetical protein